jgi:CO/xanthine dehydrogenase Mo-binding subunit
MAPAELLVVGTSAPQVEGRDKVTGGCRYTADVRLPGMLHGRTLRSPYPHAKILSIDVGRALQLPGVRAVVTAADLPEGLTGLTVKDVPLLARDRVRFVGEKVAAVAADSAEIAEDALTLIDVQYEELPHVKDPLEAMREGAPLVHDEAWAYDGVPAPARELPNVSSLVELVRGDVAQGFAECDRVFEHTFSLAGTHQGYLEPHACVVDVHDDGSAEIWASNKGIYSLRTMLSRVTGIAPELLRVNTPHVGGDFGGKQALMDIPLAYFLSRLSGHPVQMVMSYTEELTAGSIRHPAVISLRTGVRGDGRMWAQEARLVYNSGAYAGFKPSGQVGGLNSVGGCYRIPNARAQSFMVYTNTVPGGYMRTPGTPQMIFALESHVDLIARSLGMDPLEFRRLNALREGDTTAAGDRLEQVNCLTLLDRAAEAAGWSDPKPRAAIGRGIALYHRKPGGQRQGTTGHLRLLLKSPDEVIITTALPDQGTGTYTVVRQVVAEVLGLPPASVQVRTASTDDFPQETGVGGSKSTHIHGQAALGIAEQLRERLIEEAALMLEIDPGELELAAGAFGRSASAGSDGMTLPFRDVAAAALERAGAPIELLETYTPPKGLAPVTSFCAQVAEVEVDRETGAVAIRKVISVHDVGTVINPMFHQGQIDGGVIQALGYALMEQIVDEDGRVANPNLGDYKLPTAADIPELQTVLCEEAAGPIPYAGKSIAEIPNVPLPAAIANAIDDAIGVRLYALPLKAEAVYHAMRDSM